jgi:hypothetical protein
MGLELSEIINKVYREPQPNRFLASLSEFIHRHLNEEGIRQMVYNSFSDFINYHISRYGRRDLPLSFVGSIAYYYQEQLQLIVQMLDYQVGAILKSPLQGLVAYHSK